MSIFESVIDSFNRTGARYVIVGGVAGNVLGNVRLTTDVDVVFDFAERSCKLLVQALLDLQFMPRAPIDPLGLADPLLRNDWIKNKGAKVISFTHPDHSGFAVDVFTESPIPFEDLYRDSGLAPVGKSVLRHCSIAHLIQMKRVSARAKDLADIESLEKIVLERGLKR